MHFPIYSIFHFIFQIQPKMCTPDPKGRSGGGGPQSISNGTNGINYQHQMKGHVSQNFQRSYSYDTTNSASKYSR